MKNSIIFFFISIVIFPLFAQKKEVIISIDSLNFSYKISSDQDIDYLLKKKFNILHDKGYYGAQVLSIDSTETEVYVTIKKGIYYPLLILKVDTITKKIIDDANLTDLLNKGLHPYQWNFYRKKILQHLDRNGFPFGSIYFDSILFENEIFQGKLSITPNTLFTYDSLIISGKTNIKQSYLEGVLNIIPGQQFNGDDIKNITKRLKQFPYLQQTKPPQIIYYQNKCKVILHLVERKFNQIDGLIGFLPNESDNKKLLVTGEVNLSLYNILGRGKNFVLHWKKIKEQSQILDTRLFNANILGSPIDVDLQLYLLKEDSTFININRKANIAYKLNPQNAISFIGGLKTSRIIKFNITDSSTLKLSNYNVQNYGLGYLYNSLDNLLFPKRGFYFYVETTLGNKKIIKTNEFPDQIYDGISLSSLQLESWGVFQKFTKIKKQHVLLTQFKTGHIFSKNKNTLLLNDYFRIGGLNSLRGFNENYFFTVNYFTSTLEYRFYTSKESYLLLFYDQSILYNPLSVINKRDDPSGIGFGVSFRVNNNVFNFIYALGRSYYNPFNINISKIHFGYQANF